MKGKSIFFCLVIAFCANSIASAQPVNKQDSLALVDLYNSTNRSANNHWVMNKNWLTGPVATWFGITVTGTRVTAINLIQNRLNGNIPASIGNLVNLNSLLLLGNYLNDSIPSSFGNLVNLSELDLSINNLTGSIPSSLGNLVNLRALDLSHNKFSGRIPSSLANLVNLSALNLSENHITGGIPASLGNLAKLSILDLSSNQLTDSIPSSLGNLVNLTNLALSSNHLGGSIPPSLVNLSKLYSQLNFDISLNYFTFDGIELLAQTFRSLIYSPQASIRLHQNSTTLSLSAGGTLSNNTYNWYMVGQTDSTTIVGDSIFQPSRSGKYFARITNSVATQLTLNTDTIDYDVTLPVTIINLKAQQLGSMVKVEWTSLTEMNVAGYDIEKSINAVDFITIVYIHAKGNGSIPTNYSYNDVHSSPGANFYRIKAIDKDGKIIYSNTVLVNTNNDKTITIVYPIPARDILYVQTNSNQSFSLLSQSGQTLLTTNINGSGSINVSGMAAGLYYFRNNNTGSVTNVVISK